MSFARNVKFHIKDGKYDEFNKVFTTDILPMLRQQKGFKNEITLMGEREALGISMWADKASAEQYATTTYPKIVQKLSPVLTGTPVVEHYDVGVTTLAG